jgi:putative ABC transport system permease protein
VNRDPHPSSGAERVYGWLLRAYPARFRARFEAGMRHAFACEHAEACARGLQARTAFWLVTAGQTIRFGVAERRAGRARGRVGAAGFHAGPMRSLLAFDWRDAARSLRAAPMVTLLAILSLALGIGATTALFSILNSLILQPLPVRDPGRLVLLDDGSWTNPIWEQIRARQHQLADSAFAWSTERFDLSERGRTDYVTGAYASSEMFDVLGLDPSRGRFFTAADDSWSGGPDGPVAVISDAFWQDRFDRAPDIVGRALTINRVPLTIIGVLPAGFFGPEVSRRCDVVVPIAEAAAIEGNTGRLDGRSTWWLEIMARLKPGQTVEEATDALRGVQPQIRAATMPSNWPADLLKTYLDSKFTFVPASTGKSGLRRTYQAPLTALLIVVGAVLLIACANIANLLLARATARRRELSLRLALGASPGRLARQLLVESLMLACAGAALGLVFALWGSRLLVHEISENAFLNLSVDGHVLAFTTGVAVVTALVFGLAPMLTAMRVAPAEAINEQGRGVTGDRRWGVRNGLVVVQVALSLSLVVAAGLFIRSFSTLTGTALGFSPDPLLITSVNLQQAHIAPEHSTQAIEESGAPHAILQQIREAAAAVPGVADAALSAVTPISSNRWNTRVSDLPVSLPERQRLPWVNIISPQWFSVYGMRLLSGRVFGQQDGAGTPPVAIVNEAFARRFFPGPSAVGQHFRTSLSASPTTTRYEIVGVVSDAIYRSQRNGFEPTLYVPLDQMPDVGRGIELTVRAAAGPPAALERSLTQALGRVVPDAALTFQPLVNQIRQSTTQPRIVAALSGFFGGLALLLAALGLYGVTAYSVNRRRPEIGIRMALGASAAGVSRLVLVRVGWLVGVGVVAGALLSLWASHFVSSLLFGVAPRDPATFVGAAVVLVAVGALSGWLPARRAARIDPARVLREL